VRLTRRPAGLPTDPSLRSASVFNGAPRIKIKIKSGSLRIVSCGCLRQAGIEADTAVPLWEPSSPGEAAKAVCQALNSLAMPPPSRPRWGSTAPTFGLRSGGLWGVTQGCLRQASIEANTADSLWEPSSPGEAAKAVGQALNSLAMPPPSRPRWGSTAPTFDLWGGGLRVRLKAACDRPVSSQHRRFPVRAVEPQRGRESGVSGTKFIGNAAAFAASLGLDGSHICSLGRRIMGGDSRLLATGRYRG